MNAAADRPGTLSDPRDALLQRHFAPGGSVTRRIFAMAAMRAKATGCGAIATISPQSTDRAGIIRKMMACIRYRFTTFTHRPPVRDAADGQAQLR
jgi:hypothetical protein